MRVYHLATSQPIAQSDIAAKMRYLFARCETTSRIVVGGLVLAALSACGGGGTSVDGASSVAGAASGGIATTTISGKIIDGYISGATVFWDCNGNWIADVDEISTKSLSGGVYNISAQPAANCVLRAEAGIGAIDEDDNSPFVRTIRFSAIPGKPLLITPLTTLVAMGAGTESSVAATLAIPDDLTKDFLAPGASDPRSHNAARIAAAQLQNVSPYSFF